MLVDHAKTFAKISRFILAGCFAIAACSRTSGLAIHAKDGGTTSTDLGPKLDVPSDNGLVHKDAAVEAGVAIADAAPATPGLGRDSAGPEVPTINACPGAPPGTFVLGTYPLTDTGIELGLVALYDLNGDGKPDLVSARSYSVSVSLGKGGGTFAAKTDYAIGSSGTPQSMAFADLNRDGKIDLVTANSESGTVGVLLGRGDGTFATAEDYAAGNPTTGYVIGPTSVALGDLNGDGVPDIVATGKDMVSAGSGYVNTVNVLLGKGDGTFAARVVYGTGAGPSAVALGDLNGDGKLDIVTTNIDAGTVSVLPGKGDGTFSARLDSPVGGDSTSPMRNIALGDLNGDGKLDAVVADYRTSQVGMLVGSMSVLLGNGDGTFSILTSLVTDPYQTSLALVDLNEDGKLDLLVGSSSTVDVLLGMGDGTFATRGAYTGAIGGMALGDLNGDGKLDLLTRSGSSVGMLSGKGDGTFATWATYPTGEYPVSVALGDLDGDGKLDVVSANQDSDTASVLLGKGDGTFADNVDYPTGNGPTAVVLGDLSGDGKLDLALTNDKSVSVLLGKGDGTFADKVDYPTGDQPTAVALGDLNGDGQPDMVTSNSGGTSRLGTASVLLGTGGGKFAANVDYQAGNNPRGVALGDLNGDGNLDIVVADAGYDGGWSVSVLLGNGDGTFADKVDYASGMSPNSVTLGDLNHDGKLDIIMPNSSVDTVSVLLGNGDGTFADKVDFATADYPTTAALSDVNGDGWIDIVTSNSGGPPWDSGTVSVLLGNGDGTFATKLDYLGGGLGLALGDLNGDGRPDIVTTSRNSVGVLLSSCR